MKPVSDGISRTTSWKGQRGAVAVEMAIVLPLFAILLLGAFEFGDIARTHQVLQNAAREGARLSANLTNCISCSSDCTVQAATLATMRNRVVAYLQGEKITVNPSDVIVDQNYPIPISGMPAVKGSHVTINYQRSLIFPGISGLIPSARTMQLSGNAVFRNFYSNVYPLC